MKSFAKTLKRSKEDESIVFKKRIDGKLKTIHEYKIFHQSFENGKVFVVYNRNIVGEITRTRILNKLRKFIT